jgi:hypothetical protein
MNNNAELAEYARALYGNGFDIFMPVSDYKFFHYQNRENGCWGTYAVDHFGFASHTMPIHPTREFGSGMIMEYLPSSPVSAAVATSQPSNTSVIIGTHKNVQPWGIGTASFVKMEVNS